METQAIIDITFEYADGKIHSITIEANTPEGKEFIKEFWKQEEGDIGMFGNDPNSLLITTHTGREIVKTITPEERKDLEKFFEGVSFMEGMSNGKVEYHFTDSGFVVK